MRVQAPYIPASTLWWMKLFRMMESLGNTTPVFLLDAISLCSIVQ